MIIDDLRYIVETQLARSLQHRIVTPDEAQAVLASYRRLDETKRQVLLSLPLDSIIDFATRNKRSRLGGYLNEVERKAKKSTGHRLAEHDYLDVPTRGRTP